MSDWKVVDKDNHTLANMAMGLCSGGISLILGGLPPTYEVENKDSGEIRHVTARTADELGSRISSGKFDKENPS
jgi:hypothetical protein